VIVNSLEQAIAAYTEALGDLPQKGSPDAASKSLNLLLLRDELAEILSQTQAAPPAMIMNINSLDEKLKQLAVLIDRAAGRSALISWRQSLHPIQSPWWWNLDERAAAAEPGQNPLWTIPAALFLALSLSVIADTITTLKNGGLNRLSILGTLMQTLLALLAGTTFLAGGREWFEKLFTRLNINRKFQGGSRVLLALGVLILTVIISLWLPDLVARYRNRQGDQFFADKQYPNAVQSYQQSLALKPAFVKAHFNLAMAYDKARDYPNAIAEYERSINFDPQNYTAYNNLARLYILQSRDYNAALLKLNYLISNLPNVPVELQYWLFKNRGWANLELHNYGSAQGDLEWALKKRDGVAAHYLLGRLFDEQGHKDLALQHWDQLIRLINQHSGADEEVEPNWIVHAQEELLKGAAK